MKVVVVLGTRPEAIKLAPLIRGLRARPSDIRLHVVFSGQHPHLVSPILEFFDIEVDATLDVMLPQQSLASLTSRAVNLVDEALADQSPDWLVVQGDTTTAMAAALAAFYRKIPVAHLEAGLRSHRLYSPFPEEINRRFISQLASLHWAPTEGSAQVLRSEGLPSHDSRIYVTGNSGIDAALTGLERLKAWNHVEPSFQAVLDFRKKQPGGIFILVTGHRRENSGQPILEICRAIRSVAAKHPNVFFVYPVHPSQSVQEPVFAELGGCDNILLTTPKNYPDFLRLMKECDAILSDSGGIQEEAPALGKLVLVTRDETERPEALQTGHLRLVGSDQSTVEQALSDVITAHSQHGLSLPASFPYGDGNAAQRCIASLLLEPFEEFKPAASPQANATSHG